MVKRMREIRKWFRVHCARCGNTAGFRDNSLPRPRLGLLCEHCFNVEVKEPDLVEAE